MERILINLCLVGVSLIVLYRKRASIDIPNGSKYPAVLKAIWWIFFYIGTLFDPWLLTGSSL